MGVHDTRPRDLPQFTRTWRLSTRVAGPHGGLDCACAKRSRKLETLKFWHHAAAAAVIATLLLTVSRTRSDSDPLHCVVKGTQH